MMVVVLDGRNAAVLGTFPPKTHMMIITVISWNMVDFAPLRLPVDEHAVPSFELPNGNDDNDDLVDVRRIVKARCFFLDGEGEGADCG